MTSPPARGLTLLELLIAIAIFSLLSVGSYRILKGVTETHRVAGRLWSDNNEMQRALLLLQKDLLQVALRPIRNEFGDQEPALKADGRQLTFTRHGWRNFTQSSRSNLQRVSYLFDSGRLLRRYWTALDRAPDSPYREQVVLDSLNHFSVRFRDSRLRWHQSWPPRGVPQSIRMGYLPQAFEVTFDHPRFGPVVQIVPGPTFVYQGSTAPEAAGGNQSQQGSPTAGSPQGISPLNSRNQSRGGP